MKCLHFIEVVVDQTSRYIISPMKGRRGWQGMCRLRAEGAILEPGRSEALFCLLFLGTGCSITTACKVEARLCR